MPIQFQLFLSCDCFHRMSIYTYLRTHMMLKKGGRQFSMFMSGNIGTLVVLFDKAVAEGASINHCGNEAGR